MKRLRRGAAVQAVLAWLLGRYLDIALRTTRWTVEGAEHLAPLLGGPAIIAFWHERLALMPALWLHARRLPAAHGQHVFVLVSRHRDGQLIAGVLRRFGMEVVIGSSSRGAVAGLKGSLDRLAGGALVAIAPDGPRGPARIAAPGIAALAALSGAAILPCAAQTTRRRTTRSWDHMTFPLPFGRGTLVCTPPIAIPRTGWHPLLPTIATALTAAADRADAACGVR